MTQCVVLLSLFVLSSCSEDYHQDSTSLDVLAQSTTSTPDNILINQQSREEGLPGGNERDPRFDDCRCEMSILDVDNPDGTVEWSLIDVYPGGQSTDYEYDGISYSNGGGDFYKVNGVEIPLPSPFAPLNQPHYQNHMFYMVNTDNASNPADIDFTIHTQVRCYSISETGSELLATTTNHSFSWGDASQYLGSPTFWFSSHFKEFACVYLTEPTPR